MHVVGPNAREFASVMAQLRHLFMLMSHEDIVTPNMLRILTRQIARLEGLQRTLLEPSALPRPDQGGGEQGDEE